jgi:hypothetical protein
MAAAAQEGISMSSVMELYPDLYPSSVAAMTRAGEVGGFLPEACETIGQQAQQAHKFRRWFAWIWFIVFNAALSIPLVYIMVNAALTTYDRVDAAGGNVSQGEALSYLGQEACRSGQLPFWFTECPISFGGSTSRACPHRFVMGSPFTGLFLGHAPGRKTSQCSLGRWGGWPKRGFPTPRPGG